MRCRVLLETHKMERQRNEYLTHMERVSLLPCSWSVLDSFGGGGWAYTTSTLLPMQELSAEEGGLIIRHGRIIRRLRYFDIKGSSCAPGWDEGRLLCLR